MLRCAVHVPYYLEYRIFLRSYIPCFGIDFTPAFSVSARQLVDCVRTTTIRSFKLGPITTRIITGSFPDFFLSFVLISESKLSLRRTHTMKSAAASRTWKSDSARFDCTVHFCRRNTLQKSVEYLKSKHLMKFKVLHILFTEKKKRTAM